MKTDEMGVEPLGTKGTGFSPAQTVRFGNYLRLQEEYLRIGRKLEDLQEKINNETDVNKKKLLTKYFNNNVKKLRKIQFEIGIQE